MNKLFFFFLTITSISFVNAQSSSVSVIDGVFIRENNFNKVPIQHNYEIESYMMWSKRVWRVIDLKEKMNHPFYYPIEPTHSMRNLVTVIRDGICSKELTPYDPISDEFDYALLSKEACAIGEKLDTITEFDEDGNPNLIPIQDPFPTQNIRRFRIKEDWYFNSKRSVMDVRIIGICPIEEMFDEMGEYKGDRLLYWMYLPELRHTIANAPAPNPHSDVERRTYDDLMNKRKFSSYVMKESNVYGRSISSYKQNLDALLESKRIEKKIFTYEQDLWEY